MDLRYLIIARYAEFLPDGSVNIVGGDMEKLLVESFPATHPLLNCAVKLSLSHEDTTKEHTFKASIFGPSGEIVQEGFSATIQPFIGLPPEIDRIGVGIVISFPNIIFPKSGLHKISLFVDGKEAGAVPLRVQERDR